MKIEKKQKYKFLKKNDNLDDRKKKSLSLDDQRIK